MSPIHRSIYDQDSEHNGRSVSGRINSTKGRNIRARQGRELVALQSSPIPVKNEKTHAHLASLHLLAQPMQAPIETVPYSKDMNICGPFVRLRITLRRGAGGCQASTSHSPFKCLELKPLLQFRLISSILIWFSLQ